VKYYILAAPITAIRSMLIQPARIFLTTLTFSVLAAAAPVGIGSTGKSAQANDPDALGKKSLLNQREQIWGTRNESFIWAKASAEKGSPYGLCALGNCYENGVGVERSDEKARELYKKSKPELERLAARGDALTQMFCGMCYVSHDGNAKDAEEAAGWIRKAADQGYALAQYTLGSCYLVAEGVPQNAQEAVIWLRKAADQGYALGQFALGGCYLMGKGVTQDANEGVAWYRKAAEQGSPLAQYQLGDCYDRGNGVTRDYIEAAKWYRKAAEQGLAGAQCLIGCCYSSGKGVSKNNVEASRWWRKAADQGDAGAQLFLGYFYSNGETVPKDDAQAFLWFRKAADQGNPNAQFILGTSYANGIGVTPDTVEAARWWRKAAEQGDSEAQYKIGMCYATGQGVAKDIVEAVKWYRKAADQGHQEAKKCIEAATKQITGGPVAKPKTMPRLGVANITEKLRRIVIPRIDFTNTTIEEAIDFLSLRAAELDTVEPNPAKKGVPLVVSPTTSTGVAVPLIHDLRVRNVPLAVALRYVCDQTGFRYKVDDIAVTLEPDNANIGQTRTDALQNGKTSAATQRKELPQDASEEVKQYYEAAVRGDSDAQYNLGNCYDKGDGVSEDSTEAAKWYRKSAEQGNDMGQLFLGWYFSNKQENYIEANRWWLKAATQGNALAQNALGFSYGAGQGVSKDLTESTKWYRKSAEQGNRDAQVVLGACYFLGQGVPKNNVLAYMWFDIANVSNSAFDLAKQHLKDATQQMTNEQIAEAQRLSRAWRPTLTIVSSPGTPRKPLAKDNDVSPIPTAQRRSTSSSPSQAEDGERLIHGGRVIQRDNGLQPANGLHRANGLQSAGGLR